MVNFRCYRTNFSSYFSILLAYLHFNSGKPLFATCSFAPECTFISIPESHCNFNVKCSHYKAPRAHHCRICKRCVLRMVPSTNYSNATTCFFIIIDSNLHQSAFFVLGRTTTVYGLITVLGMRTTNFPNLCSICCNSKPLFYGTFLYLNCSSNIIFLEIEHNMIHVYIRFWL